jgi:hypothetical protein
MVALPRKNEIKKSVSKLIKKGVKQNCFTPFFHEPSLQNAKYIIAKDVPAFIRKDGSKSGDGIKFFKGFESIRDIYNYVLSKPQEQRVFYEEYIQQKNNCVKLFFDIDIYIVNLSDELKKDINNTMQKIIFAIRLAINDIFIEELGESIDHCLFVSNSTTKDKLSLHIIVNKIMFENYLMVKHVAIKIIKYMEDNQDKGEIYKLLSGGVIDLAVYSCVRAFRLLYSSKLGKTNIKYKYHDYTHDRKNMTYSFDHFKQSKYVSK